MVIYCFQDCLALSVVVLKLRLSAAWYHNSAIGFGLCLVVYQDILFLCLSTMDKDVILEDKGSKKPLRRNRIPHRKRLEHVKRHKPPVSVSVESSCHWFGCTVLVYFGYEINCFFMSLF